MPHTLRVSFTPALLGALCLSLIPVASCQARSAPAKNQATQNAASSSQPPLNPSEARRIELLIRGQLNVPPDWTITPGSRSPSDLPGFDTLHVGFAPSTDTAHPQSLDFLLSKDGKTLARLSKYDLTAVPGTDIPTAGRPVRGNANAKVEIVNFDDLECPYCARMHAELFPETLDHYKGLVKVVYKDDPLTEIHPWALHAAVDANCLAAQNHTAYWHYVDYLHTHGDDVNGPDHDLPKAKTLLDHLATEEGARGNLDKTKLAACLTRQDDAEVRTSMKEAATLHIDGTPSLFIDGERVAGAQPIPYLWAAIDRALRAQGITPPPEPATAAAPAQPAGTR